MATIFYSNGHYDSFQLPSDPDKLLAALREAVGGHLEVVALTGGRRMVVNEEGIDLKLPFNERATFFAAADLMDGDYIKGNAVLCAPGEFEAADQGFLFP